MIDIIYRHDSVLKLFNGLIVITFMYITEEYFSLPFDFLFVLAKFDKVSLFKFLLFIMIIDES